LFHQLIDQSKQLKMFGHKAQFSDELMEDYAKHGIEVKYHSFCFGRYVLSLSKCFRNLKASLVVAFRFKSLVVIDPSKIFHYRWLTIITVAILYNVLMIIGRSVFWTLENLCPWVWFSIDYFCDFLYIIDMIISLRTGKLTILY